MSQNNKANPLKINSWKKLINLPSKEFEGKKASLSYEQAHDYTTINNMTLLNDQVVLSTAMGTVVLTKKNFKKMILEKINEKTT